MSDVNYELRAMSNGGYSVFQMDEIQKLTLDGQGRMAFARAVYLTQTKNAIYPIFSAARTNVSWAKFLTVETLYTTSLQVLRNSLSKK